MRWRERLYTARRRMRLLDLNRRYKNARVRIYIEQGFYLLQTPLRLAAYGSVVFYALSARGVIQSQWFLWLSVPVGLAVLFSVGVLWTRYGWQQQEQEVSLIEGMSRLSQVAAEHNFRIILGIDRILKLLGDREGCPYGDIPPGVRREVVEVLASFKGNGAQS